MNKTLEKLKDILYDSFDYIVMIAIVVIVVAIIGWRLDVLFAKDIDDEVAGEPVVIDVDRPEIEEPNEEEVHNEDENPEGEETPEKEEEPAQPVVVKITIPAGSLPGKIGLILEENGVIDNSKAFIAKAVEMKLDRKMKSGTFSLTTGSSYEEILKIITK